jgi:hypothetical protein
MLEFEWYNILHSCISPGVPLSASCDAYENATVGVIYNGIHYA